MKPASPLHLVARSLAAPARGILAADESVGTIEKRFRAVGLPNSLAMRQAYREMLLSTPGLGDYISGVILHEETLAQRTSDDRTMVRLLHDQGIIPGVKVDRGLQPLEQCPGEFVAEGLDGLRDRLKIYAVAGARFAKWRVVYSVSASTPSPTSFTVNAHILARFAALCQENDLLPLIEPEILMDGDHSIARHAAATSAALQAVFAALHLHRVRSEDVLLKTNMVLSGSTCADQAPLDEVADTTVAVLRRFVPAAVPGIMFLSGGQGDVQATERLSAINRLSGAPWELSFSFGRALQAPALRRWAGNPEAATEAQQALLHRARCNAAARSGTYTTAMETSSL